MADSKSFIIFGFTQQRTQAKPCGGWESGALGSQSTQAGWARHSSRSLPKCQENSHETASIEPERQCVWWTQGMSVRGIRQLTCSVPSNKSSGFTGGQWHLKSLSSNLDISSDLCHDLRSLNLLRLQVSHARGPYT